MDSSQCLPKPAADFPLAADREPHTYRSIGTQSSGLQLPEQQKPQPAYHLQVAALGKALFHFKGKSRRDAALSIISVRISPLLFLQSTHHFVDFTFLISCSRSDSRARLTSEIMKSSKSIFFSGSSSRAEIISWYFGLFSWPYGESSMRKTTLSTKLLFYCITLKKTTDQTQKPEPHNKARHLCNN